jgi:hypothetical protein
MGVKAITHNPIFNMFFTFHIHVYSRPLYYGFHLHLHWSTWFSPGEALALLRPTLDGVGRSGTEDWGGSAAGSSPKSDVAPASATDVPRPAPALALAVTAPPTGRGMREGSVSSVKGKANQSVFSTAVGRGANLPTTRKGWWLNDLNDQQIFVSFQSIEKKGQW